MADMLLLVIACVLINPGLLSPTASPLSQPSLRWLKDCTQAGLQPGCTCFDLTMASTNWTVTDLTVQASASGAGTGGVRLPGLAAEPPPADGGGIAFKLDNRAAGYVTPCAASSARLADFSISEDDGSDGGVWWSCDDAAPQNAPGHGSFRFDLLTRRLDINQSWTCDGGDFWSTWEARGSAIIPLSCNDSLAGYDPGPDPDPGAPGAPGNPGQKMATTNYALRTEQCSNTTFMVPWAAIDGVM